MIGQPPTWAVVQHTPNEGPGLIGSVLCEAGHLVSVVRTDQGQCLPQPTELAGLVVLGGPMGVGDLGAHPWLAVERSLLAAAVELDLPVLGIGLGAQQLALALGAEVTAGPAAEVGVGHVELTAAGRRDPVFGPEYSGLGVTTVPCVHRHGDTLSLPAGAVHLAATRVYPHQAFRFGARAYGLQFHVEIDPGVAVGWGPARPGGSTLSPDQVARIGTVGRRLIVRFLAASVRLDRAGPRPVLGSGATA